MVGLQDPRANRLDGTTVEPLLIWIQELRPSMARLRPGSGVAAAWSRGGNCLLSPRPWKRIQGVRQTYALTRPAITSSPNGALTLGPVEFGELLQGRPFQHHFVYLAQALTPSHS